MMFVLALAVALFAACQPDEPKTPPNSPIPEIDKTTDPKPAPFGDAGTSSNKSEKEKVKWASSHSSYSD